MPGTWFLKLYKKTDEGDELVASTQVNYNKLSRVRGPHLSGLAIYNLKKKGRVRIVTEIDGTFEYVLDKIDPTKAVPMKDGVVIEEQKDASVV